VPLSYWATLSVLLGIAMLTVVLWGRRSALVEGQGETDRWTALDAVPILLLAVGLFLRFAYLGEFMGGRFVADENLVAVYYVTSLMEGEPNRFGVGKAAFGIVADAWYRLVGFEVYNARLFSALQGALGLGFAFLGARRVAGRRTALWFTALLAVALYAIHFSKLALAIACVLFLGPVLFWLVARYLTGGGPGNLMAAGVVAGLATFTYTGLPLGMLATAGGVVLVWLTDCLRGRRLLLDDVRDLYKPVLWTAAGLLPLLALGALWHESLSQPGVNFTGGGSLDLRPTTLATALVEILEDLFVAGNSWFLVYRKVPFVETALLPVALLGAVTAWRRPNNLLIRGVIVSLPVLVLINTATGPYPGMRRALFLLLPFYYLVALGIVHMLDGSSRRENPGSWPSSAASRVFVLLLGIALIHSLAYQFSNGRATARVNFGEGYIRERISDEYLLRLLEDRHVVLDGREFEGYFDEILYRGFAARAVRYGLLTNSSTRIHFLDEPRDPYVASLADRSDWVFLSWQRGRMFRLSEDHPVCISRDLLASRAGIPYSAYPESAQLADSDRVLCLGDEGWLARVGESVQLGYRHLEERFYHHLECENALCDPSRQDFVHTGNKGAVRFVLRVPPRKKQFVLRLQVTHASDDRRARVVVENRFLGLLESSRVGTDHSAEFPLSSALVRDKRVVRVKLQGTGEPGFQGWDVVAAALLSW
jgi:hypothetical protein